MDWEFILENVEIFFHISDLVLHVENFSNENKIDYYKKIKNSDSFDFYSKMKINIINELINS